MPSTPKPVSLGAGLSGRTASDLEGTNDSLRMLESVSTGAVLAAALALQHDRQTILRTGISLKVLSHGGSKRSRRLPRLSRPSCTALGRSPGGFWDSERGR